LIFDGIVYDYWGRALLRSVGKIAAELIFTMKKGGGIESQLIEFFYRQFTLPHGKFKKIKCGNYESFARMQVS
jgi:hypothetical protein